MRRDRASISEFRLSDARPARPWSGIEAAGLSRCANRGGDMILFLVFVLIVLWLLGMVTTYTLGGWLHILLVIAVVFLLIRVIRGQGI
jgi:predicted ferric reductase